MVQLTSAFAVSVLLSLTLIGCHSKSIPSGSKSVPSGALSKPVMSMEEARGIAAEFKVISHVAPPRTIDDLKNLFQNGRSVPQNCEQIRDTRWTEILEAQQKLELETGYRVVTQAANLVTLSERLISIGRFDEAINSIDRAYQKVPDSSFAVRKAIFATQLSRLHARIGNLRQAEEQFAISFSWWEDTNVYLGTNSEGENVQQMGTLGSWLEKPTGRLYYNSGKAEIARLRGELPLAEYHYREALGNFRYGDKYSHINVSALHAGLAMVISHQDRLMEAEAEARSAIQALDFKNSSLQKYHGNNAAPVTALAGILLEQGKSADAEYLARIAVNMHEVGCSEPQSLGLTEARQILINAMAEQGNWSGILEQVDEARQSLESDGQFFNRQYEESLAYIEAEINAGAVGLGRELARGLKTEMLDEFGPDSYQFAEVEGILALVEASDQLQFKYALKYALNRFSKIMPILIHPTSNEKLANRGRRNRILQGYMELMTRIISRIDYKSIDTEIPDQLLRVASFLHQGRVEKATSASAVRAATGDPELANLMRQLQDLNEEAQSLGDILAYVQIAPPESRTYASVGELKTRLAAVAQAKHTLEVEVLNSFPDYSELLNPTPMAIKEIRNYLGPEQSLLIYHSGMDSTYVWGISPGGGLSFTDIDMGAAQLKSKITSLRRAVDPDAISTLNDIPAFNVNIAHELYSAVLEPIKSSWQDSSEILIVANGPLGALPFSMLATEAGISEVDDTILFDRYRSVQWLVNQVAISQLPSINTLKTLATFQGKAKKNRRAFAGFGDPFFSVQQKEAVSIKVASRGVSFRATPKTRSVASADLALLPRLPDTRDEVLSIARELGANPDRDLFLGLAASEEFVKSTDLSEYSIISFATHGLVPGDLNGLNEPALAFTTPVLIGGSEDGLLTMNEILGLKLDADFVVLSACNTAAADAKSVEAVSGLGRAFFYAGARAILVSNWPVHSGATTSLMVEIFKQLAADKSLSRTEALRHAKLHQINHDGFRSDGKLIFSYAHPIFWAPFTLVGDGG